MTRLVLILSFVMVLGFSSLTHADLVNNGGGLIYDTDLNITWYDAPAAAGPWSAKMTWASNLSKGGVTGWRLPSPGEEMGHLYYVELGNTGVPDFKKGPFNNLIPFQYYSGYRVSFNNSDVYFFNFATGDVNYGFEGSYMYALAVHEGNVGAPVPIPAAVWLLGSGLAGLIVIRRRFTS